MAAAGPHEPGDGDASDARDPVARRNGGPRGGGADDDAGAGAPQEGARLPTTPGMVVLRGSIFGTVAGGVLAAGLFGLLGVIGEFVVDPVTDAPAGGTELILVVVLVAFVLGSIAGVIAGTVAGILAVAAHRRSGGDLAAVRRAVGAVAAVAAVAAMILVIDPADVGHGWFLAVGGAAGLGAGITGWGLAPVLLRP